ncbi:pyruvate dehydrogenase E1 component [Methylophilaceae bacterium]|nr:pyruvate dehydrogenase E1 component [Methylophilaceae bacterium]
MEKLSFYKPASDSPEIKYMMERREALGGFVPQRKRKGNSLKTPPLSAFENM